MSKRSVWRDVTDAAEAYDTYVSPVMAPWLPIVDAAAAVQPGATVLDLACGTGFMTTRLRESAGTAGRVVALDLSQAMLRRGRAKASVGAAAPTGWCATDAGRLPVRSASVDVAVCQQALQFFPDRVQAAQEVRRALRPGGTFVATVWGAFDATPYFRAIATTLEAHGEPGAAEDVASLFACDDADGLRDDMDRAGFPSVNVERRSATVAIEDAAGFVPRHMRGFVFGDRLAGWSPKQRDAFFSDLFDRLQPVIVEGSMRLDTTVNLVTARA